MSWLWETDRGSWGGSSDPDRDIPRFAQLYLGKLPLDQLITKRYDLIH